MWKSFPSVYQSGVLRCFIKFLLNLGYERFDNIFHNDISKLEGNERFYKRVIPDIAEAILQRDYEEAYFQSAHDDLLAFQEVVNSISEVMVNKKINKMSIGFLPPLAK